MAPTIRPRLTVEVASAEQRSHDSTRVLLDADLPTFTPPSFTMKELLGAIPAECFERSAFKSSLYIVRDFALIAAFGFAASHTDTALGSNGSLLAGWIGTTAKWAAWSLYWAFAGFAFTGVWIIGASLPPLLG